MYYLCSESKGADQLCSHCTADLHLCFRICRLLVNWCIVSYYSPNHLLLDVTNCSFVVFQIWDLPGHLDYFDSTFDPEHIFGGCDALIFVIDAQVCQGPEVIKLFSCSTQLSMKFQLLINTEIIKIGRKFRVRLAKPVIYPVDK